MGEIKQKVDGRISWEPYEIDFAVGAKCYFCDRQLKRGIALFLQSSDRTIVPSGPYCAAKVAVAAPMKVPDFTKGVLEGVGEEDVPSNDRKVSARPAGAGIHSPKKEGVLPIEYLRLRVEKLHDFRDVRTPRLVEIHNRSKESQIAEDDLRYLGNLETKMSQSRPTLSLKNLQACHAYKYWIERLINEPKADYPRSLLVYLREHLYLTEAQVVGLNSWFRNRDMPTLDPSAFSRPLKRSNLESS